VQAPGKDNPMAAKGQPAAAAGFHCGAAVKMLAGERIDASRADNRFRTPKPGGSAVHSFAGLIFMFPKS